MTPEEKMTEIVPAPADSSGNPEVIAYRMGQVEIAVKEGLRELKLEMRLLRDGFVSHQQLSDVQKNADTVHTEHDKRITKLENNISRVVWLVLTAVILALLALVLKSGFVK